MRQMWAVAGRQQAICFKPWSNSCELRNFSGVKFGLAVLLRVKNWNFVAVAGRQQAVCFQPWSNSRELRNFSGVKLVLRAICFTPRSNSRNGGGRSNYSFAALEPAHFALLSHFPKSGHLFSCPDRVWDSSIPTPVTEYLQGGFTFWHTEWP